jgi:hypothetical protein
MAMTTSSSISVKALRVLMRNPLRRTVESATVQIHGLVAMGVYPEGGSIPQPRVAQRTLGRGYRLPPICPERVG